MRTARKAYQIPITPLRWLAVSLTLAALPLWTELSPLVLLGFAGGLAWRCVSGIPWRGAFLALGLVIGMGGIYLMHGALLGLDPGMEVLLLVSALKFLEMRAERDFHVMLFLGFFLILTALFFNQDLILCLYAALVLIGLTMTLVRFNAGESGSLKFAGLLKYCALLFAQALPLIALLFIFFPRSSIGVFFRLNSLMHATTGLSDRLDPGSIAELAGGTEIVFRAEFLDERRVSPSDLYWRAGVLMDCHGLRWSRGWNDSPDLLQPIVTGQRIEQRITAEPHRGRWVLALDRPVTAPQGTRFIMGNSLEALGGTLKRMPPYSVESAMGDDLTSLAPGLTRVCTRVPPKLSNAVTELVQSWKTASAEPGEIVKAGLNFFRQGKFRYTLRPGTYSANDELDEFLFRRRSGFCEHYAAAFATLMRQAGIPARVVIGYHGGEYNRFGKHVVVRQSDAHAWCEVWIEETGWKRIDPSTTLDPARADPEALARMNGAGATAAANEAQQGGLLSRLTYDARMAWDDLNYRWNSSVLSYNDESQRDLFFGLGLSQSPVFMTGLIILLGFIFTAALAWLMLNRRIESSDDVKKLYERFCKMLARAGLSRGAQEGPLDFADRAADKYPSAAEMIREISALYIELRYRSFDPDGMRRMQNAVRNFAAYRVSVPPRSTPAEVVLKT